MSESKKWTKKKKLIVALSVVGAFLIIVLCGGIYALHWYCKTVDYDVVSSVNVATNDTELVAHRGFRALAPENTLPAFEEAGKNGFSAAECDVYMTKDGVWVVQHDPNTFRMMNTTRSIEKSTLKDLQKYKTDNGNNVDKYEDLKICTLDEYLDACKKYHMLAVIEIKGKNNTEHYDKIVDSVKAHGVSAMYISFNADNLVKMRKLTDAPMMYLVNKMTDESISTAKSIENCGIDFDASKEKNFENDAEIIKKAKAEGLTLGAWTVDDLETMQRAVDYGVEYITTDCITY